MGNPVTRFFKDIFWSLRELLNNLFPEGFDKGLGNKRYILIFGIVFVIVVLTGFVLLFAFAKEENSRSEANREYDELQQLVVEELETIPEEDLKKEFEEAVDETGDAPVNVDFAKLDNPDTVGYLYMKEADISYPVVQGENDDSYLNTTYGGQPSSTGCLFVYSGNKSDFTSPVTFILGHNMTNGSMFGNLKNIYKDINDYSDLSFTLYKPDGTKTDYKVFSVCVVPNDSDIYEDEITEEDLPAYFAKVKAKSVYKTDMTYSTGQKITALSTCFGLHGTTNRLLFFGISE